MVPARLVGSKGSLVATPVGVLHADSTACVVAERTAGFADLELGHDAQRDCLGGHAGIQVDKSKALAASTRSSLRQASGSCSGVEARRLTDASAHTSHCWGLQQCRLWLRAVC